MADNTMREQILSIIATKCNDISGIKTVERRHPSFDEARKFPSTMLPYIGIVGGLPVPTENGNYQSGIGDIFRVQSRMDVQLLFFDSVSGQYDTKISYWADEIWREINEILKPIPSTKALWMEFDAMPGINPPVIAFFAIIHVEYLHTIEKI